MKKKLVLIGADGMIGSKIKETFKNEDYEILSASKSSHEHPIDFEDVNSILSFYEKIGSFDALVCAAGRLSLAPFEQLDQQNWSITIQSKLMGQINLVQKGLPFIKSGGSFTLVSGIDPVTAGGVPASVANRGVEAFVAASALEMPKSLRINVVSPGLLTESQEAYGALFPGAKTVPGSDVALAFKRSVMGVQTGQVFKVHPY